MISQIYPQSFFTHDFSSYLVQVDALRQYGHSYSVFWDIKPPGLQIILFIWSIPFGTSFLSYFLFNALLVACTLISIRWLINFYLPTKYQLLPWILILTTQGLYADYGGNFLSSDFIGLAFILPSISLLISKKSRNFQLLALLGLLYAGSIKEVFIFTPLVFLSLITRNNWKAVLRYFSLICISFYLFIAFYLIIIKELSTYINILSFKKEVFAVKLWPFLGHSFFNILNMLKSEIPITISILLILIIAFLNYKRIKEIRNLSLEVKILTSLVFFLFLGLLFQQKSFSSHYLLALYLPTLIAMLLVLYKFLLRFEESVLYFNLILTIVLILSIFFSPPKFGKIVSMSKASTWIQNFETPSSIQEYIVPGSGCMQVIFGWEAGSFYHYSNRKPCSKYFLANILQMSAKESENYVKEIISNPPEKVIYDTKGADLDVSQFELRVFPWTRILSSCYYKVDFRTFSAKFQESRLLVSCFNEVLKS